jgi:ribosomal protein L35AE/L33A
MGRLLAAVVAVALARGAVRVENLAGAAVDPLAIPNTAKAIVFLFTSTDCPISNRYAPELRRLATLFAPKGAVFRLVYPNPAEDAAAIRTHIVDFAYGGAAEALRDPKHALVKFTGATITPEAVVYAAGRVQYRGRVDNRFVDFGVDRPAATEHDLHDAIAAILAGKPVAHPETQAVGCYIADFAR